MRPLSLSALLCLGCATSPFPKTSLSSLPSGSDYPEEDAIVIRDNRLIEYKLHEGHPVADVTDERAIRILKKKGRDNATFYRSYSKSFSSVTSAHVRVTKPNGSTRNVDRSQMSDRLAISNAVLYQDQRYLMWSQSGLPLGSLVEHRSTVREKRPNIFYHRFYFGDSHPTLSSRLEVRIPKGWKIEHTSTQYWQPIEFKPQVIQEKEHTRYIWERKKLAPLPKERWTASKWDRLPMVAARLTQWEVKGKKQHSFKSLQEFSKWMYDLQKGTDKPTPKLEKIVQDVLQDAPKDPKERARLLYEWVQSNIRYIAVEVGMGGWRPYTAKEVLDTQYGDCKDKANLLRSMLKIAGIKSYMASLYSHSGFPRRFIFPTIGNSNHAILAIDLPGELVVVDPTTRTVPFGTLPANDQEAELLLIKETGGKVVKMPSANASQNLLHTRMSLKLSESGDAYGAFQLKATGGMASRLKRGLLRDPTKKKAWLKSWLELKRGEVTEAKSNSELAQDPLKASGTLKIPALLPPSGSLRQLRLFESLDLPCPKLEEKERTSPVVFRRKRHEITEVFIQLPQTLHAPNLPAPVQVESEFGRYKLAWSSEGTKLKATIDFELSQRLVPKEKYQDLKSFLDKIIATESQAVILRAK